MEVILKEDVPKLGHRGEVVKVAEGYGRNYLLPQKLAIEATTANRAVIEQMKQILPVRQVGCQKKPPRTALGSSQQLDGTAVELHAQSRREGHHLFGSVTTSDIAGSPGAQGASISIGASFNTG